MFPTKRRRDYGELIYELAYELLRPPTVQELERRRAELARLRNRLACSPNLRATVRARLILLIDRILGALRLILARLRSALSQRTGAPSATLTLLAERLRYSHRDDPGGDHCSVPVYAFIRRDRGVAHALG
jgi:hypothetical protein